MAGSSTLHIIGLALTRGTGKPKYREAFPSAKLRLPNLAAHLSNILHIFSGRELHKRAKPYEREKNQISLLHPGRCDYIFGRTKYDFRV